jgi:hypothetical protein
VDDDPWESFVRLYSFQLFFFVLIFVFLGHIKVHPYFDWTEAKKRDNSRMIRLKVV